MFEFELPTGADEKPNCIPPLRPCPPVADFGGTFPADKEHEHCTPLEDFEQARREINDTVKQLTAFKAYMEDEFNRMLSEITSDNVVFKDTYRESYEKLIEEIETEINAFESNVDGTIKLFVTDHEKTTNEKIEAFQASVTEQIASLRSAFESRLETIYSAFSSSATDYQTKLTTDINMFEATVNTTVNNHVESTAETLRIFRETVEAVLNERLNTQDGKISDAELYLKTNLSASIRAEIDDMYQRGELDSIVSETVPAEAFLIVDGETGKIYNVFVNNGDLKMTDTGKTIDDYNSGVTA